MKALILSAFAAITLTACGPTFQTTSGAAFVADSRGTIDPNIAKVADIEPDLRLPARIGLARVVNGQLTTIPSAEAEMFGELAQTHRAMGEFVPVSPLITAMISDRPGSARGVLNQIRETAARQHLDYVMIYEAGARSRRTNTPFALADVTIIGGVLLPTRKIDVMGIGQVMFVDTRSGYPYATVSTTTDLTGFGRSWSSHLAEDDLRNRAVADVVKALVPQVDELLVGVTQRAGRRG